MTTLVDKVSELKALRAEKKLAEQNVWDQQQILNKNEDYQELIRRKVSKELLVEQTAKLEEEIRAAAIADFKDTGNKHPAPGLTIKIFRTLAYDLQKAEEWARINAPAVFKFSPKAFEKVAEELNAPVKVEEDPRAQIDSELP